MINIKAILYIGLVLTSCTRLLAQYSLEDFSLKTDFQVWYDDQVGLLNTVLLNGERVEFTRKSPVSHAFYLQKTWLDVDITYSGQRFENVPALYNLEEDFLMIKNPLTVATPMKLTKDLVSSFHMDGDHFVFVDEKVGFRSPGYYKLLYKDDDMVLLGKLYKKLEIKSGVLTYRLNSEYFLKLEGNYYQIKRFGNLKRLFPEHKKELRAFKRELSLRGRYDVRKEDKLARLVEFCDNLTEK